MKKNRSDIEFYQNMMDMLQQEKSSLREQLDAERKSREEETRQILEENRALRGELVRLAEQLRRREEEDRIHRENEAKKDEEIGALMNRVVSLQTDLNNAIAALRLGRGRRFAPSSEKSSQIGKDRSDSRAAEKDDFDGAPPAGSGDAGNGTEEMDKSAKTERPKAKKKKSAGRKKPLEDYE